RGVIVVAGREVVQRAPLLGLAILVLAAVPIAPPLIGIDDRPFLGQLLGVLMVLTAALITSASVLASDVAGGRLGFFLARPVPWWSVWGGKILAALVLTFAAGGIVLGPASLGREWTLPSGSWLWTPILVPTVLVP